MTRIASLLLAASLVTSTGVAQAETGQGDNWNGVGEAIVVFGSIELAPPVLLLADLVVRPHSKGYAYTEIAIGVSATLVTASIGSAFVFDSNCPDCRDTWPYFATMAAVDLASVAHGAYLLMRDEPMPAIEVGSARGRITPTMVTDGKATAPGLGLGGTF